MRIAVVAHVYYPELWPELAVCIRNIGGDHDLYVSYSDEDRIACVRRDFPAAHFVRCENCGFDVWPFLKVLRTMDLNGYDLVVKLHTKRDVNFDGDFRINGCRLNGAAWRNRLLSFCRDAEAWREALSQFDDSRAGMVADGGLIVRRNDLKWDVTRQCYDRAVREMCAVPGVGIPTDGSCPYVSGTMFAVRAEPLRLLLRKHFAAGDFQPSEHAADGGFIMQYAHVVEHLLGFCVAAAGLEIVPARRSLPQVVLTRLSAPLKRAVRGIETAVRSFAAGRRVRKFDRIVSLGMNCEVAYRFYRKWGFVESSLFGWSKVSDLATLTRALSDLDAILSGEVAMDDRSLMWRCGRTGIWFHGRLRHPKLGGKVPDREEKERDLLDLRGRVGHLRAKFRDSLADERSTLLVHRLAKEDARATDLAERLDGLEAALASLGARNWLLLVVCEKEDLSRMPAGGNRIFRGVKRFNPIDKVVDESLGDTPGWMALFSEFAPARVLPKSHGFKFE